MMKDSVLEEEPRAKAARKSVVDHRCYCCYCCCCCYSQAQLQVYCCYYWEHVVVDCLIQRQTTVTAAAAVERQTKMKDRVADGVEVRQSTTMNRQRQVL